MKSLWVIVLLWAAGASEAVSPAPEAVMRDDVKQLAAASTLPEKIRLAARLCVQAAQHPRHEAVRQAEQEGKSELDRRMKAGDLPELERLAKKADAGQAEIIRYLLMTRHYLNGDLAAARRCWRELKQSHPHGRVVTAWVTEDDARALDGGLEALKEIDGKQLPPDERLWELGREWMWLMSVSWNQGPSGMEWNLATRHFRDVVARYPASPWVPRAAYELQAIAEEDHHREGVPTIACLPWYEAFIKRYPKSELVVKAKMDMAAHYALFPLYDGGPLPEGSAYAKRAVKIYDEVIAAYPETSQAKKALAKKKSLERYIK